MPTALLDFSTNLNRGSKRVGKFSCEIAKVQYLNITRDHTLTLRQKSLYTWMSRIGSTKNGGRNLLQVLIAELINRRNSLYR